MKKIIYKTFTFILFILTIAPSYSQKKLVGMYSERYSNGTFSPFDSVTYHYNTDGKQSGWTSKYYSRDSAKWINLLSYEFTYNTNGDISTELVKNWSANNWKEINLNTYLYDNNNRLISKSTSRWYDNQWNPGPKTEYFYSTNATSDSSIYYNYSNNTHIRSTKNIYSYNLDNKISLDLDFYWDRNNDSWVLFARKMYMYNSKGLNNLITTAEKAQIGWNTTFTQEITYDSDDDMRMVITKDGNGETLSRREYIYNSPTTGLNNVSSFSAQVYPNPTSNLCNIEWSGQDSYSIRVFDIKGRTLKTINDISSNAISFNITDFEDGVYYYTITANSIYKTLSGKFVVSH